MPPMLITLSYLLASVCFILGLKWLSSPRTAVRGNQISWIGMTIAIVVTLLKEGLVSYEVLFAGMLVGGVVGLWMARTVQMTAMPQVVAVLNGLGGGASMLIGIAEYLISRQQEQPLSGDATFTLQLTLLTGAITFSGSAIAFAKLQELMSGRALVFPLQKTLNAALGLLVLGLAAWQVVNPAAPDAVFWGVVVLSLVIGIMIVIPIGGADMPVVIALLNSCSGVAVAMTGFLIRNDVLIISGALVGSSGLILTYLMCKAMNRSLFNVMFGAFGAVDTVAGGVMKSAEGLTVRQVTADDAAVQLAYAQSVIVIPGYGLAVAQAQHLVRELADLIEKRGGTVRYAIHPVAGRMPGHMNVLLAEANIPYEKLIEMDRINAEFERTDVALVIGANDVVNPAARNDPASPIYGMPILNADQARAIIVMKRGMGSGFAGIENELFYSPKTGMLFGDAKATLQKLVQEVKAV